MNSWYHLKIGFKHKFSMSGAVINRPFCYQFHFSIQLKRKEKKEKKIRLCANIFETVT